MKRIVILGAGESGAGAAVLAKVKGFETFVSDMSAIKDKYKELLDSHAIAWEEGHHTEELILNADEVVKSPGIPNDAPLILKLKAHLYPFAAVKEDGAIAYVEDHEVKITEPIAFNMEQEELALTGQHNLYNSLAAGISANLAGIAKENIRKALSDFRGVEHRLEKVARVRGIDFINDSKATNFNSCWYALQSMTTKTVLILGGKDKGNDYTEIEDLVREKCSALVYLGLHNEKLHDFFDRFGLPVADVQTGMKDAVEAAYKLAKKGETVLLSPCCASFDLFNSYEDRGDQFKKYVREL